jgi:dephospho-CoA kinase
MLKVGITGGIGSGKTTVAKLFEALNIPVYYADDRAKWLMANDKNLRQALINLLGDEVFDSGNQLNRKAIASKVFANPTLLSQLNQLVHPAVASDFNAWSSTFEHEKPYVLKEAALLVESGSYKELDKLIVVNAPLELRIERTIKRDNTTRQAVLDRIKNQLADEEKIKLADFIIQNGLMDNLTEQVQTIHQSLS